MRGHTNRPTRMSALPPTTREYAQRGPRSLAANGWSHDVNRGCPLSTSAPPIPRLILDCRNARLNDLGVWVHRTGFIQLLERFLVVAAATQSTAQPQADIQPVREQPAGGTELLNRPGVVSRRQQEPSEIVGQPPIIRVEPHGRAVHLRGGFEVLSSQMAKASSHCLLRRFLALRVLELAGERRIRRHFEHSGRYQGFVEPAERQSSRALVT